MKICAERPNLHRGIRREKVRCASFCTESKLCSNCEWTGDCFPGDCQGERAIDASWESMSYVEIWDLAWKFQKQMAEVVEDCWSSFGTKLVCGISMYKLWVYHAADDDDDDDGIDNWYIHDMYECTLLLLKHGGNLMSTRGSTATLSHSLSLIGQFF